MCDKIDMTLLCLTYYRFTCFVHATKNVSVNCGFKAASCINLSIGLTQIMPTSAVSILIYLSVYSG